jgi:hypothetical protein
MEKLRGNGEEPAGGRRNRIGNLADPAGYSESPPGWQACFNASAVSAEGWATTAGLNGFAPGRAFRPFCRPR